jgi:hypothetical protein
LLSTLDLAGLALVHIFEGTLLVKGKKTALSLLVNTLSKLVKLLCRYDIGLRMGSDLLAVIDHLIIVGHVGDNIANNMAAQGQNTIGGVAFRGSYECPIVDL